MARPKENEVERFWSKVSKTDTDKCWVWKAGKFRGGYGQFMVGRKNVKAHRYSYKLHFGKFPETMFVCHRCDNTSCVNPRHLFLGSAFDNVRDQILKNRRHDSAGEKNGACKLKEKMVLKIREEYRQGVSQYKLAKKFKISQCHVSDIVNLKRWGWL